MARCVAAEFAVDAGELDQVVDAQVRVGAAGVQQVQAAVQVLGGGGVVAFGEVDAGEVSQGYGLPGRVGHGVGEGVGLLEVGGGLRQPAGTGVHQAESVDGVDLAGPVVEFAVEGQGVAEVAGGVGRSGGAG